MQTERLGFFKKHSCQLILDCFEGLVDIACCEISEIQLDFPMRPHLRAAHVHDLFLSNIDCMVNYHSTVD